MANGNTEMYGFLTNASLKSRMKNHILNFASVAENVKPLY